MAKDLIELISNRVSSPRLAEPAPSSSQLESIYACALRAPDHMLLRPWRYLVIEGAGREALGEVFVEAARAGDEVLTDAQEAKFRSMPLRAPMMLVAVSNNEEHPKVPVLEQQMSCGVGVGYMLLALQSLGFNGVWRTGAMAESAVVKQRLGIEDHETLVGFLYIGTPAGDLKAVPQLDSKQYFHQWQG